MDGWKIKKVNLNRSFGSLSEQVRRCFFIENSCAEKISYSRFLILALVFLTSRLIVWWAGFIRGVVWPGTDSLQYIAIAKSLVEASIIPHGEANSLRQFPGISYIISLPARVMPDYLLWGVLVTGVASLLAILLFYRLSGSFRCSFLFVFFMPAWITGSVMTEGLGFVFIILLMMAFLRKSDDRMFYLLLILSGFGVLVRFTSVLPMGIFMLVYMYLSKYSFKRMVKALAAVSLFGFVYLILNTITIHNPLPQLLLYSEAIKVDGVDGYNNRSFSWPAHSLIQGFMHIDVNPLKKMSTAFSMGSFVAAMLILMVSSSDNRRPLRMAIFFSMAAYLFFHLLIGGSYGFTGMDRYLAQLSPFVCLAILRCGNPKWFWGTSIKSEYR